MEIVIKVIFLIEELITYKRNTDRKPKYCLKLRSHPDILIFVYPW